MGTEETNLQKYKMHWDNYAECFVYDVPVKPKPSPVIVSGAMDADEANDTYGDRYGVDWVYE